MGANVRRCEIETLPEAASQEFRFESRRECSTGERGMEAANHVRTRLRKHRCERGGLESAKEAVYLEHNWHSPA